MCFDAVMASLWFGFVRTSEKPSVKTLVSEIVLLCTQFPRFGGSRVITVGDLSRFPVRH